MRSLVFGAYPFCLRDFRGRRFPRLPVRSSSELNGKEGVSRFESGRGLCKSAARWRFSVHVDLLVIERAVGMEPFMEPSDLNAAT